MKSEEKTITPTQGMGSKMRIKLYDPKTHLLISDRLVEQATELVKGPTEKHIGPISLEVNLMNQVQVDLSIDYLKKLKGELPIENKPVKEITKTKTLDKMLSAKEPLLELVKTVKAKCNTQEQLINTLREYNFVFLDATFINDLREGNENVKEQITLRDRDMEQGFQYMVRRMKEAKEPMNDKYDFRLVFGIKYVGDKTDKVVIYLFGKFSEFYKVKWEKPRAMNFKKVEKVYVFPDFMDYAERKRWRTEHRKWMSLTSNGEKPDAYEPSHFYNKYKPYIKGY